jgi:hypothetical protein
MVLSKLPSAVEQLRREGLYVLEYRLWTVLKEV